MSYLGLFSAPAANEQGHVVEAEVFHLRTDAKVEPAAEIEEIVWIDAAHPACLPLAPLTRDHLLPFAARRSASEEK